MHVLPATISQIYQNADKMVVPRESFWPVVAIGHRSSILCLKSSKSSNRIDMQSGRSPCLVNAVFRGWRARQPTCLEVGRILEAWKNLAHTT